MIRRVLRFLLPVAIFALGIAIFIALVRSRPKAAKVARDEAGAMVEVMDVSRDDKPVVVKAHGTVIPSRQVVLAPEVAGKVTWVADELVPGGRFVAGDPILRLDGRDYDLAVSATSAAVDQAETALELEQRRKDVTRREWERMGKKGDPMSLRDKQVAAARVAVKSARSSVKRARLNVGRTLVRAPFNAVVQQRAVDLGQIVGPQSPVVTLVGTDAFWVQISVPVEDLAWMEVPGVAGATEGSPATIWRQLDGVRVERKGRIIRLLGDVDPMGRMARVLVEIHDPLGVHDDDTPVTGEKPAAPRSLPLLLGSFVQVNITGRHARSVVEVPREALRDGDTVYVMKPEKLHVTRAFRELLSWADADTVDELTSLSRLDIRKVDVVWRQRDTVYVRAGLEPGDKIVTSPVPTPIQGMPLRSALASEDDSAQAAAVHAGSGAERQE